MAIHFLREVEKLKREILALSALVEERLGKAVTAIETRDATLAHLVINKDSEIDAKEVDIEEECLRILALYQPVAADLRYVVAALKINNDMERIGDLAVNIAERALLMNVKPPPPVTFDLTGMARKAQAMVTGSIDALVYLDARAAREVCLADDVVDHMNREAYDRIKEAIEKNPTADSISSLIYLLSVSRALERIADHATNIAEDVVYMMEGHIIRHHPEAYRRQERLARQ